MNNILNAKNEDGSPISIEEVKTECFVLMVAASDTTAAFFCGFLRYVLQTPGVYERLVTEIDEFEGRGLLATPVATFDQIKQMPYLSACHKETLRFQPSTPMIIPRYVSGDGLDLYGQHVPPGTEIAPTHTLFTVTRAFSVKMRMNSVQSDGLRTLIRHKTWNAISSPGVTAHEFALVKTLPC